MNPTQTLVYMILILALFMGIFNASYSVFNPKNGRKFPLFFLNLCLFFIASMHLMELVSTSEESLLIWHDLKLFAWFFYPAVWLFVSIDLTRKLTKGKIFLTLVLGLSSLSLVIVRFLDPRYSLFYTSFQRSQGMFFWRLEATKGPFYTVFLGYLFVALIAALAVYLTAAVTNGKKHRRLFIESFLVTLIPVLFFMAELYDPFKTGLDFLSTGMLTSIAMLSYINLKSSWKAVAQRAKADLFQNDENPMILIDRGYTLLDFNAKAEQYFPELDETVLGLNLKTILVRGKMLLEHLEHPMHPNLDFKYGENLYTFEIKTTKVTDDRKIELGTLIRLIDVSEIRKERESLHRLATRDSLTGLLNRRQFMSLARLAFERNRIDDSGLGVLLFNIDKFSEINRTFGTHVGDEVLRGVSAKLSEVFRKSDIVGRIGGEEFAAVLPSIKAEDALKLAMKCCTLIHESTFTFDGKTVQTTISSGVCVTRSKEDTLDEILRCAYVALKESKEKGRNQVSLYVENATNPTEEVK
ncbi:MAG TPA: hypothetical protein DEO50_05305 [Erysipelotrichaceae bacterium]|nr:diguanylate cyclase [Erysipelotrichaceae bacterium]OGS58058.1 MAG: hypothetical protein A2Y19_05845 [Firmicutes bacterium GWE2_51_13]HBZ41301.1 hypothetical protein [Erysipelotrichaceae bacterium]